MSLCQFSPARRTPIGRPSSVTLETTTISGLPGTLHRSPKMLNSISPKRRVKATCCGGDVLIAEEDYGVIIVSALDGGERLVVEPDVTGSGAIDTNKDIGAPGRQAMPLSGKV